MKEDKLIKDIYAIISTNPFFGIMKFEYGMVLLDKKLKENKLPFNFYLISVKEYNRMRVRSLLHAKMHKRHIIEFFKKKLKDDKNVAFIDYEHNKFMIVTGKDLTEIINERSENVKVGATERKEDDTVVMLFMRANEALGAIGVDTLKILK